MKYKDLNKPSALDKVVAKTTIVPTLTSTDSDDLGPDWVAYETPTNSNELGPDWVAYEDHYGTPGQQIITGIEGLAQGVAGPLATAAEKGLSAIGVPGLTDEDIVGRQEANPKIHGAAEATGFVGSLFIPGYGEVNAALKGTKAANAAMKGIEAANIISKAAQETSVLAKAGSTAIKGAIEAGWLQGGDELSKMMLGQQDPEAPVAAALMNMGAGALFGGATGGLFGGIGAGTSKLHQKYGAELGSDINKFLAGVGVESRLINEPDVQKFRELAEKIASMSKQERLEFVKKSVDHPLKQQLLLHADDVAFQRGQNAYKWMMDNTGPLAQKAISVGLGAYGAHMFGADAILGAWLGKDFGLGSSTITPLIRKFGKSTVKPVLLKVMSTLDSDGQINPNSIWKALDYGHQVNSGLNKLNKSVDSLFKVGQKITLDTYEQERYRKRLKEYIEQGGIRQNIDEQMQMNNGAAQGFAEGGEALSQDTDDADGIATFFPEQSAAMGLAKGRISNYLSNMQPIKYAPKRAFDKEPPKASAERTYNTAIDIANDPLSVFAHISNGTLRKEHVQHLQAMYPEAYNLMQNKLTERITQAQLNGEKPTYKVRQGMSMLMGVDLDSTFTPAAINAAQSVYTSKQAPASGAEGTAPVKNKRGTASLSKVSNNYLTGDQARQERQNKV